MPACGATSRKRRRSPVFCQLFLDDRQRLLHLRGSCHGLGSRTPRCLQALQSGAIFACSRPAWRSPDRGRRCWSWANCLAGGDPLARLHVMHAELPGHVDVDRLGVAGLDLQRADDAVRQRHEAERRQQDRRQPAQARVEMRLFHFVDPPGHVKELAQLVQRHDQQSPQRHRHHDLADDLQLVRLEQLVEEPQIDSTTTQR